MLISDKHNFIFIHIEKTAGTSLMETLAKHVDDLRPLCYKHDGTTEGISELGKEKWETYFKFAFVRNPWDRLLSWYSMFKNTPEKTTVFREYIYANADSFEGFLKNCTDFVEDEEHGNQSIVKNQYEYLIDDKGELSVDYIGRFETINESVKEVFGKIGIDQNIVLPRVNHASVHRHYSTYYTPELVTLVREMYALDIDKFGYAFK